MADTIPSIGQGDEIKASWLNQIVEKANGLDRPYDGQYYGTSRGYLLQKPMPGEERPEAQSPDTLFQTRVVPNCWQLTAYPFDYSTDGDPSEKHVYINLGRSFQTLRSCVTVNGKPIDQVVLLPSDTAKDPYVLSGPEDLDDEISTSLWTPTESEQLSNVADTNTGWVDTGFVAGTDSGVYMVVACNATGDDLKSTLILTDIEAKSPENATGVIEELERREVMQLSDVTHIPLAEAVGGWTLSSEWGEGDYGDNGAHVWNCYTTGTQHLTIGETPEDTMVPEINQQSVERKKFTIADPEAQTEKSYLVRQLYNFNVLSSYDFPAKKPELLSSLHWLLRLHEEEGEEGGEGEEGEGSGSTTKLVYSSVIHPDSFKGVNAVSSIEYCDYSESEYEYSLFKFKDMENVDYDPEEHDILVRNHDGTLEYVASIGSGISGDANYFPQPSSNRSIETIELPGEEGQTTKCHQIFEFNDPSNSVDPVINFIADGQPHDLWDYGIDSIMRNRGAQVVEYHAPKYILPEMVTTEEISAISGDINDISTIVDGIIERIEDLSGDWWPKGGAYDECYGQSIGNDSQNMVIDLDNRVLANGTWTVLSDLHVNGNLTVDLSSSLHDTTVNGQLSVLSSAVVSGDLTVGGDLYVPNGTLHLNDVECQNLSAEFIWAIGAEVNGMLSAQTLEGQYCTVDNFEALSSFAVGAPTANFAGDMLVGGDATFYSHASFGDSVGIVNDLEVNGTADFADAVTMGEDLDVAGAVVCGSLSATGGSVTIGSTTLDEQTLQDLIALLNQQRSLRAVPLGSVKYTTQLMVDQNADQLSGS